MEIRWRIILNFVHAPDNSIEKVLNTISYHTEQLFAQNGHCTKLGTSNSGPTCHQDFTNGVKISKNKFGGMPQKLL